MPARDFYVPLDTEPLGGPLLAEKKIFISIILETQYLILFYERRKPKIGN